MSLDHHSAARPNGHPALAGREQEMGFLADQVRRLIELTVTCDVPADVAQELGSRLEALNDRLARHRPTRSHPRLWPPAPSASTPESPRRDASTPDPPSRGHGHAATMVDAMPYDVMVGRYNPLAPPLVVEIAPPKAYAKATFTVAYEGAPGWVHGAVIAGAFDMVLTAANHLDAAAGPTTRLDIRYLRPTLLDEEACFEAWIDHRQGRRVVSKGILVQQGTVRVEAEGEFAAVDPRRILRQRHEST